MRLRRLLPAIAIVVFGVVPAALAVSADPWGAVEVADSTTRPPGLFNDDASQLAVDANGNALWASFARNSKGDDQLAIYERCGTTWQRTLLGTPAANFFGTGIEFAANGTAMAVWRVEDGNTDTHYSAIRGPGGSWEQPQTIVSDSDISNVQFALSDGGAAVAVWADPTPGGIWASFRPAGGAWGAPEKVANPMLRHDVAMSATGDAVLLYQQTTPGYVYSKYHSAGGSWGGEVKVIENTFQNTIKDLMVEFDGGGRTVAMASFNENVTDALRVNTGSNGAWGATNQQLGDDEPNAQQWRLRNTKALVRHPGGLVAAWERRTQSFVIETVVSRFNGTSWDTPKPFAVYGPTVAVNGVGEILVAGTAGNDPETHAVIASSLSAAWPAIARVSPPGTSSDQFRDPEAGGGGNDFYLAWGVHGGSNERTEVISTKPSTTCAATPTATPTATATATPSATPDPLPATPTPTATPTSTPTPTPTQAPPSAIADFTTLPAASKCIRGRKLTIKFKKPPKGYTVKTVTVKVNAKKVATVKGKQLKKPLYLRKLPKGTFTLTVTITLTKGKGLTEKRRYTACK
ncbi:hypothetical protein [Solirubrobacter soli]|uniref:hypothetical protein n=1 Tax=Solirubrobacter soli TaxID=363832 RepID=UPI00040CFF48|nr:hypothetical protein [Solirubrobacter soli]